LALKLGTGHAKNLTVVAQVRLTGFAVLTFVAKNDRLECDSIPDAPAGNAASERDNFSGSLMAHYDWWKSPSGTPVQPMNVTSTNSACLYTD
jgi:hypothetical protein